ncbi:MAG: tyrosine-type recombinase/integrase [Acidimicrobiales bacterium]
MRVQRLIMPVTGAVSWTVVDDEGAPVKPVERYLAHLAAIERSPNTVKAYAHGLRLWFEFLAVRSLPWDSVAVEEVSRFAGWLRSPGPNVIVFDDRSALRSAATVNRHLAAVFGLYDFHARSGVEVAADLVAWRRVSRGSYKPFLHHVSAGRPIATRPVKLRVTKTLPKTLTTTQVTTILAACTRLRDRFLMALLAETGMRVGQALGLRHEDFVSRECAVRIVPRDDNANGARAKCRAPVEIPVSASLVRLYSDYLHTEYGSIDSDYVFVNLWSQPMSRPMCSDTVAKLVGRLRARTGIEFSPHTFRHTRATELVRAGTPIEVVSKLLTHRSVLTTSAAYVHLDVEDLRAELVRSGAWEEPT